MYEFGATEALPFYEGVHTLPRQAGFTSSSNKKVVTIYWTLCPALVLCVKKIVRRAILAVTKKAYKFR